MSESLSALLRRRAPELAPRLATRALELGLAVTKPDASRVPISVTLTPVIVEERVRAERHENARALASAGLKMTRAIVLGPRRELLLGALSPLERKLTESGISRLHELAITRVDFFIDAHQPWALELNSTIPAMPGYSDIAAQAFLETLGAAAQLSPLEVAALVELNGSNTGALLQALKTGHHKLRPDRSIERMAILCRRNDPQISELYFMAERFHELGVATDIVFPDELTADKAPAARGHTYDLVYRHLFVRRLEETPAPAVLTLLERAPSIPNAVLLNPPSTPIEVKTVFALLSESNTDEALAQEAGLSDAERHAIRQSIPWTRLLRHEPGLDPDGERVADLVERVAEESARFVLKRAWDYGGRAVFIGASADDAGFAERSKRAFGQALSWKDLCLRAARDPVGGGFVVQERVVVEPQAHLLCTPVGAQGVELFVDYSAYASVGLDPEPRWGGVCRGSSSAVVNIVGGGGVLPLITDEVAQKLTHALNEKTGR